MKNSHKNIIRVPKDFDTIQEAINSAGPCTLIKVAPGVYNESLKFKNSLVKLQGSGIKKTIVDGTGLKDQSGAVIPEHLAQIVVEDMSFRHFSNAGMVVLGSRNVIRGVEFSHNGGDGMSIGRVDDSGNKVIGNNNYVSEVIASNNGDEGFDIRSNSNTILQSVAVNNAERGFQVVADPNALLTSGFGNTLAKNTSNNNGLDGIDINASKNMILKNKCKNNTRDGVRLDFIDNSAIGNVVRNNRNGIDINAANNLVVDNKTKGNEEGISISDPSANHNVILNNEISESSEVGIKVETDQNLIECNEVGKDNVLGINLTDNSKNNCLIQNEVKSKIVDDGKNNIIIR